MPLTIAWAKYLLPLLNKEAAYLGFSLKFLDNPTKINSSKESQSYNDFKVSNEFKSTV